MAADVALPSGFTLDNAASLADIHGFQLDRPQDISLDNVARSVARGIPILGGLANRADAALNASLAPVFDRFLPDSYDKLPEATWDARYGHALGLQNAMDRGYDAAHPIASAAGQVAGGVASLAPLAATAPGAQLLGLAGRSLAGRVARGAATGTALWAADAAVRGEDISRSALTGGILGAALPPVSRALAHYGGILGPALLERIKPSSLEDILMPGGERIGAAGTSPDIRLLPGGLAAARSMLERLTRSATDITPKTYPGKMFKTPDGGLIGLRPESTSGPPTIDFRDVGVPIRKLKFPENMQ